MPNKFGVYKNIESRGIKLPVAFVFLREIGAGYRDEG